MEAGSRVLVLRQGAVGDTILATPLLASIKAFAPATRIAVLATPAGKEVLDGNPNVDRIIVAEQPVPRYNWRSVAERLKEFAPDVAINLGEKLEDYIWTRVSGAKVRIGFTSGANQPLKTIAVTLCLTHFVPVPNDPNRIEGHEVERYLSLLKPLGIPVRTEPLLLTRTLEDRKAISRWLKEREVPEGAVLIGFHLCAKWFSEGWGMAYLFQLLLRVQERFKDAVLLAAYGGAESHWADSMANALEREKIRVFAGGGKGVKKWGELVSRMQVQVSMDTGAIHVAAGVGTPVVDIFPEKHFEHVSARWAPWQIKSRIIKRERLPESLGSEDREEHQLEFEEVVCRAIASLLEETRDG